MRSIARIRLRHRIIKKRKPNRQLDCKGIQLNSSKLQVGKITFLPKEPPMKPLGDLGKW